MNVMFNPPVPAGFLNTMLFTEDTRPAAEQFNERYAHGGGWHPNGKSTVEKQEDGKYHMLFPGDPPMEEIARAQLRDETIVLFEYEFVAIIQPDGSAQVDRMD